jgi:hypothetical protein
MESQEFQIAVCLNSNWWPDFDTAKGELISQNWADELPSVMLKLTGI